MPYMAASLLFCLTLLQTTRVEDPLVSIATKYSLRVEVVDKPQVIQGAGYRIEIDPPSKEDLAAYTKLFSSEWNRYPIEVTKKAGLKAIVIGSNIRMNTQIRASVPAFDTGIMYYDTTLGKKHPEFQRSVVHHEFYHLLDERQGKIWVDKPWSELNPPDFHYGKGGAAMREAGVGKLTDKLPGFITLYSTSAIEEDKAEIFAHLLVDPVFLDDRVKADPVVSSKVAFLKQRLKDWVSAVDDCFWKSKATD